MNNIDRSRSPSFFAALFILTAVPLAAGPAPADSAAVQRGAKLFQTHCLACHGPGLTGSDRRNLGDGVWHHVTTPGDVVRVIDAGLADNLMPGFKVSLRPAQRADLAAYILSLPNAPGAGGVEAGAASGVR